MLNTKTFPKSAYAFFDVDETVISMKSMFTFTNLYFETYPDNVLQEQFKTEMEELFRNDTSWNIVNARYYSYFKHFPIARVEKVCQKWFSKYALNQPDFYHKNIVNILKDHQKNNIECVFVSGSFRELLQPIADALGVKHILSINMERDGLAYTGEIIPPQTIGVGKADAVSLFLDSYNGDSQLSYAYGDDISDAPMLEIVGNPVAVTGGRRLEAHAKEKGWDIVHPH